jgi:hypothetical protein
MRRRDFATMVGGMAIACSRPATVQTARADEVVE